jgi:hypothetical protein
MSNENDSAKEQFGVYQMLPTSTSDENVSIEYLLAAGPFDNRRQAIKKSEELRQSSAGYYSFLVERYRGKSWFREQPSEFKEELHD